MDDIRHKIVFIVEDNEMYSMMLDYSLSRESVYRFVSFRTAEECMRNLDMNPSLIILDYELPGINGLKALEEIKKYNKNIPVVVLSANKDVNLTKKLLDAGAYDYVTKEEDAVGQIKGIIDKVLTDSKLGMKNKPHTLIKVLAGLFVFIVFLIGLILFVYRKA